MMAVLRAGMVEAQSVDEQVVGRGRKFADGLRHRETGGLVDVDAVDGLGIHFLDGAANGFLLHDFGEAFTIFDFKLLGVAEAADTAVEWKDDGCGDDGTEEGAASYFVDARNDGGPGGSGSALIFVAADQGAQHLQLARCGGESAWIFSGSAVCFNLQSFKIELCKFVFPNKPAACHGFTQCNARLAAEGCG